MSTLTQTAPNTISIDYLNAPSEDSKQTFLTGTVELPVNHPERNPLDSVRLTYTPTWFGLGAGATALSLLAARRYGAPAIAGIGALGAASRPCVAVRGPGLASARLSVEEPGIGRPAGCSSTRLLQATCGLCTTRAIAPRSSGLEILAWSSANC